MVGIMALATMTMLPAASAAESAANEILFECVSTPTEGILPVGIGLTTSAAASASVGCSPAFQGGVRGFTMTASASSSASGSSSLFVYSLSASANAGSSSCSDNVAQAGPATESCFASTSFFCAAPTSATTCSVSASASSQAVNINVPVDRASASDSRSVSCRYLV